MKRLIFITFICFASLGLTNAQKNAIGLAQSETLGDCVKILIFAS